MSTQLNAWQGTFGKEYTDRCLIDWRKRKVAFEKMLEGLTLRNILEVGCNRGHNLIAINDILGEKCQIIGIEPNNYAIEVARAQSAKIAVVKANSYDIPFKNNFFDLVFTAGVLIHISPKDLDKAMREIYRVSGKYILAVEYFAENETEISYRGNSELLWKRNFLHNYQKLFPDLKVINTGFWEKENTDFDSTHWWLMEKTGKSHLNAKDIDLIVYDFDGVMTDNRVILSEDGKESILANRSDGLAIGFIKKMNIPQIILSTEKNPVVRKRAEKLDLEVINSCSDKKQAIQKYCSEKGYNLEKVVFVGNDTNDLEAMKIVGYPVAPSDACAQIIEISKIVTAAKGGCGVIRELFEYIAQ